MAEMTAVEFLKAWMIMCKKYRINGCLDCPFDKAKKEGFLSCTRKMTENPEDAVSIVQKWSEEHPQKTMMQDFFEKFKKAKRKPTGEPVICPYTLGYEPEPLACKTGELVCNKCWNRPLEE